MIEIVNLSYTYPVSKQPALRDINLSVEEGTFLAIVGPNGAGKSTLCNTLAGLIPHFYRGRLEGTITVMGRDIHTTPFAAVAGEVGLVFQNPFNQITGARFTVRDEVAFGLENAGVPREEMMARIEAALAQAGLLAQADQSPLALSGGQQQRLAIASVLVMNPRLLILDEPTAQLDPAGTREVFAVLRELIQRGDTTIVLVEHKIEWIAAFADRVIALSEGQILADDSPREVLTSRSLAEAGIAQTAFTQAAQRAAALGLVRGDMPLPVTLAQAVDFFS